MCLDQYFELRCIWPRVVMVKEERCSFAFACGVLKKLKEAFSVEGGIAEILSLATRKQSGRNKVVAHMGSISDCNAHVH
jgi:hypothetical protein